MTKEILDRALELADGEIVFSDGFALTDWSGDRYCCYTPSQEFGEGTVCDKDDAIKFYCEHRKEV